MENRENYGNGLSLEVTPLEGVCADSAGALNRWELQYVPLNIDYRFYHRGWHIYG